MSTSEVTKRSRHLCQPYVRPSKDGSRVARAPHTQLSGDTTPSTTSDGPSASSPANPATRAPMRAIRDYYLADIRKRFPKFTPRNDFDILALGDGLYKGPEEEVYAWLDKELASHVDASQAIEGARTLLSTKGVITGNKPSPGDPGVFIRPIPDSSYSIRLFPGSPSTQEYCLDFVKTDTGMPVNSPFKFELWSVGIASIPHIAGAERLRSLEYSFGHSKKDIIPGEEKFVLRDGMTCILKRPGHKIIRFTVPIRLANDSETPPGDETVIDFPKYTA